MNPPIHITASAPFTPIDFSTGEIHHHTSIHEWMRRNLESEDAMSYDGRVAAYRTIAHNLTTKTKIHQAAPHFGSQSPCVTN